MKTISTIQELAKNIYSVSKSFAALNGKKSESIKDIEKILSFYENRCRILDKDFFYVNIMSDGFIMVNDETMFNGLNCKVYLFSDKIEALYMIK